MKKIIAFLVLCLILPGMLGAPAMAAGCVDKDRDYWCDDCGMLIPHTCVDYNKDTWCDKCSCWIPHTCYDKDGDHLCDQCGTVLRVNINITVTSSLPQYDCTLYFYESTYPNIFKVLTGSPASHTFTCAGNKYFELVVMKYGHPTRTYRYDTKTSDINISAALYTYGDASQDGQINMGDISRIYAHTRGTALITDDYALKCADASQDGQINMGDVSRTYAHIRQTKPLF